MQSLTYYVYAQLELAAALLRKMAVEAAINKSKT
jgi:hypothetical protein